MNAGASETLEKSGLVDEIEVQLPARGLQDRHDGPIRGQGTTGRVMNQRRVKNTLAVLVGLALASLGVYNIVLKATWTLMDDGAFWKSAPQGLVAVRIDPGGPASRAGIEGGDILLAVDGQEVLTRADLETTLASRRPGDHVMYKLLREDERRETNLTVQPLPKGDVSGFYYLSLVGFFSLVVGTVVMLRRPAERSTLHFYAICVLFFLAYSISYTGKLDVVDWGLFWVDSLARLFLPVVFLHFCLTFPERRLRAQRLWLVPALYMPALVLAGAVAMSQALGVAGEGTAALWGIVAAIDRFQPLYFAVFFAMAFAALRDSYRRTRSLTARRQVKWLVWGTGGAVVPFLAFYALPFALGKRAGAGHEAGRLRAAGPHPALAGLRGGQAPPDGRGADRPPGPGLRSGGGGPRGRRPADRRPHGRPLGGAGQRRHRASQRHGGGAPVHAGQEPGPGGARAALLPGALQLSQGPRPSLRGPQRRSRPRADQRETSRGGRGSAWTSGDGPLPSRSRRRVPALPGPRRAPHRRGAAGGPGADRAARGRPGRGRGVVSGRPPDAWRAWAWGGCFPAA